MLSQHRTQVTLEDRYGAVRDVVLLKMSSSSVFEDLRKKYPKLDRTTFDNYIKSSAKIIKQHEQQRSRDQIRLKSPKYPIFEAILVRVLCAAERSQFLLLPKYLVKKLGDTIQEKLEIPRAERLKFGSGWFRSLSRRYGFKFHKTHGQANSTDPLLIPKERQNIHDIIRAFLLDKGGSLDDVFNTDETSFELTALPEHTFVTQPKSGFKVSKKRFTVNATGTEKLEPLIIGKAKQPCCFKKRTARQLGFTSYYNSRSGWMNGMIFELFLGDWNERLRQQGNRKILLLMDNFAAHHIFVEFSNIKMVFFKPNMTPHLQPLDAGIIKATKAAYKGLSTDIVFQRLMDGVTGLNLYVSDQLEFMNLVKQAWSMIATEVIVNCWRHTGIIDLRMSRKAVCLDNYKEFLDKKLRKLEKALLAHDPETKLSSASEILEECERLSRLSMSDLDTIITLMKDELDSDEEQGENVEQPAQMEPTKVQQEKIAVTSEEI